MNAGDWWRDTQNQLAATATIVPVICAYDKTYLPNSLGNQHAWPQYVMIGNIPRNTYRTPNTPTWILIRVIPCPPQGAKNIDEAWHNAVGTVLSQLTHLEITGSGLKW